jgi:hypothetical protein
MGKIIKITLNSKSIINRQKEILKNKTYSDVILELENGVKLELHKNILCFSSDYFEEKLNSDTKILTIEEKNIDLFKAFIEFLYTGEITKEDFYFDFLFLCDKVYIIIKLV